MPLSRRDRFWTAVSLMAGAWLVAYPGAAQAEEQFGNQGITMDVDTIVEFEFLESNGLYRSTFGVINLATGDRTPLIVEVIPTDGLPSTGRTVNRVTSGPPGSTDVGSPGNAVPEPLAEFEFKANTPYAFYLESFLNGQPAGIYYSAVEQNRDRGTRSSFEGNFSDLAAGGVIVRWDDTGSLLVRPSQQDRDFDDFIVRAGGHLSCP